MLNWMGGCMIRNKQFRHEKNHISHWCKCGPFDKKTRVARVSYKLGPHHADPSLTFDLRHIYNKPPEKILYQFISHSKFSPSK